jgi:hypothetical protein
VEELGDLAVVEPLDGQLDLARVVGCGGDGVVAGGGVAVRRGEPHDVVLPGDVPARLGQCEAEGAGARSFVADGEHAGGLPAQGAAMGGAAGGERHAQSPW